jgi:hypothetical protein
VREFDGSHKLTPEQQDYYEQRFGMRFVRVQETPIVASRKERRRRRYRPRSER